MDYIDFLKKIKQGELSIEEGLEVLENLPYEDIGCAKLDHHRSLRSGFGEVIYCEGKKIDHLIDIFIHFDRQNENVLGTRASESQYKALKLKLDNIKYNPLSRTIIIEKKETEKIGNILVATGGTSDIPIAEEAAETAEFFGAKVTRVYDVGVAGIHRLLAQRELFNEANVVIAVAGMEGALPSVIAGLVHIPVIGVPTSVGYGAHLNGLAPLFTMLNSCAEGLTVVNIDNGFGAGYSAAQINQLIVGD